MFNFNFKKPTFLKVDDGLVVVSEIAAMTRAGPYHVDVHMKNGKVFALTAECLAEIAAEIPDAYKANNFGALTMIGYLRQKLGAPLPAAFAPTKENVRRMKGVILAPFNK